MPRTSSAKKALRAASRKRARNLAYLKQIKQLIKLTRRGLVAGKASKKIELAKFNQLVDKAAKVGVVHKNKAARLKSRLARRLKNKP